MDNFCDFDDGTATMDQLLVRSRIINTVRSLDREDPFRIISCLVLVTDARLPLP